MKNQEKYSFLTYSYFVKILGVIFVYTLFGQTGLYFASINSNPTVVWLPTAVALSSFLFFSYRIWPAIFIGAVIVHASTTGATFVSFFLAIGNTLEGYLGAYLINKFARGSDVFSRMQDFSRFVLFTVLLCTALGATMGVITLYLGGFATWDNFVSDWFSWWLADATGVLIFTPALLLWAKNRKIELGQNKIIEFFVLTALNIIVGLIILNQSFYFSFLILPSLIWLVFRFNPREVATFIAFFSTVTIFFAEYGIELLKNYPQSQLIFIQEFVAVIAISILPISILLYEEKKSKLKQEEIASIFESIDKSIIATTLSGTINYWNKGAEKLFGYKAFEVMKKNINQFFPEDKKEELAHIKESIMEGKEIENLETTRIGKHGRLLDVSSTYSPIFNIKGKIIGISAIAFDMTEQRKLEHTTKEEYEKETIKLRKEFIMNASHELRTPLAIIKGSIDVDLKPESKKLSNLKSSIEVIEDEVKHLANIVQKLTTLSGYKSTLNNEKIRHKEVILADVLKESAEKYKNSNNNKNVSISFGNIDKSTIFGDKDNLNTLFSNIIENSITYSGDNVKIDISVEKSKNQLSVLITDNGIGIIKNDMSHIFDEFYRSDKSRTNEQGKTGLGLAIAKSIVEAHGGSIRAKSEMGKGTTIVVSFPLRY